jgi:hypothetical protein
MMQADISNSNRRSVFGAVALAGLVGAVFWSVLEFDFVGWDDDISVTQNPLLTEPWSWSLVVGLFDGSTAMRFKPLHWLAFRGIYGLFGLNPMAWHAFGLLLHVLAAVLFCCVLRAVLRRVFPEGAGAGVDVAAWLGAALWAVHPLRVEPVAWVTGSSYPLTAVFLLGSYWSYLRGRLPLACLFAVGAYSSYPVGVTYGLWLIATDAGLLRIAPPRPWRLFDADVRRWWFKQAAFIAPAMLAVGVTLWTRVMAPGIFNEAPPSSVVPVADRLLMGAATLTLFVKKFLWPTALTPNLPGLEHAVWSDGLILGAAALAVLGGGLLALKLRKWPRAFWLGMGFVGLSLPCLGLTEWPTLPVDRYSYLLDLLLAGSLAGAGLVAWRRLKWRRLQLAGGIVCVSVAVLVVAVSATRRLLPVWRDTDALFTHMERHPDFAASPGQQAHVYRLWTRHALLEGRVEEARDRLQQANDVYHGVIRVALRHGHYEEAVTWSRHMEANLGITPVMRRERGYWLLRLGRTREAQHELHRVVEALPDDPRTRELLQQVSENK